MPSPASPQSQPNILQHVLDDAEAELRRRLHEACEADAKGISTESSAEIRRLEDALLAAAMAAEQTITMRRHLNEQATPEEEQPTGSAIADRSSRSAGRGEITPAPEQTASNEKNATGVREFRDDDGHKWRAWPVIPGLSRSSAAGRGFLGNFQNGWVCFESLDTPARRRLPAPQPGWPDITDEELRRLLTLAIDAPERATTAKAKPGEAAGDR